MPSSVGQQSPLDKPMALQAEFLAQEAATAWGALIVLFDDLQHPNMFPEVSGQHAPCSFKAAQAELSSQAPRRVVVTVATFNGSWQQDCDAPLASGQQSPTSPIPTHAVLSTQRIAPPWTLFMAFGFGTLTKTTPHNSTAPISNPAPSQRLLLACGPRPCKTSMSSAPDAPRQVSWLSLRVRSISLVVCCYSFWRVRRLRGLRTAAHSALRPGLLKCVRLRDWLAKGCEDTLPYVTN